MAANRTDRILGTSPRAAWAGTVGAIASSSGLLALLGALGATGCGRGLCGSSPQTSSSSRERVERATKIFAGARHTCVLLESGRVACWGDNQVGELGVGDEAEHDGLAVVRGLSEVVAFHTSDIESCAVRRDGTLWCWGDARRLAPAQIRLPHRATDVRVSGYGKCILYDTGEVACVSRERLLPVAGLSNVVAIGIGGRVACAANARADLSCWDVREPETVHAVDPSPLREVGSWSEFIVLRAQSERHPRTPYGGFERLQAAICALGASGKVVCTRAMYPERERRDEVVALAGRDNQACALDLAGRVRCWRYTAGCSEWGCADVAGVSTCGPFPDNAKLSVGAGHTCMLGSDGTRVRCYGANESGQLGYHRPAHETDPQEIPGIDDATDLAVGAQNACVVRRRGTVECWGKNSHGEAGDATARLALSPVTVPGICDAVAVAMGSYGCALLAAGTVACWGWRKSPGSGAALIPGIRNALEIRMGTSQACVRNAQGKVLCWTATPLENGDSFAPRPKQITGVTRAATLFAAGPDALCEREAGASELRCWGSVPERWLDCVQLSSSIELDFEPPTVCQPAFRWDRSAHTTVAKPFVLPFGGTVELLQAQGTWCNRSQAGSVSCWDGCSGLGGDGLPTRFEAQPLSGLPAAVRLVDGDRSICALSQAGSVVCVAVDGVADPWRARCTRWREAGEPLVGLGQVVQLEGGGGRICARVASGGVRCWGQREHAPLGDGRSLFHDVPVELVVASAEVTRER